MQAICRLYHFFCISVLSTFKGPFTRAIFVAILLILTHAIEWLSHKSIDLYIAFHRWSNTFVSQSI